MMPTAQLENQQVRVRRWPGLLLSLFVPGLGLARAGRPLRGLAWFIGVQLIGVAIALLLIARAVPTWVVCTAMFVAFMCFLVMLADSFKPGRLTWPLIVIFVIVLIVQVALPSVSHLVATVFKVPTAAMEPTLIGDSHGAPDHVIVDRVSYLISQPKRGDLVVFRTKGIMGIEGDGDLFFVKRLVGLPEERIEIRDGHVLADGRFLDESTGIPPIKYISRRTPSTSPENAGYAVPKDEFFFLGDNSANSFDSRYWGSVPRKNIYGKVARIYYPWSRVGVPR